jgi:hypothetical protein
MKKPGKQAEAVFLAFRVLKRPALRHSLAHPAPAGQGRPGRFQQPGAKKPASNSAAEEN